MLPRNEEAPAPSERPRPEHLSLVKGDGLVEILSDVVVPEKYLRRLSFGLPVLDEIFGGAEMPGLVRGTSFLITGIPGSGKSTTCLRLADLLQQHSGRSVLYNVGEENREMVKLRASRLGIEGRFRVSTFDEVEDLSHFCRSNDVDVLFQDSLQSLRCGDLRGHSGLRAIVKRLHVDLAKGNDTVVFVVGHSTKGGVFAGPQEIKHDVDGHAHLSVDRETGNRILELEKNRFGPAMVRYEFKLGAGGMDLRRVEAAGEGGVSHSGNRASERRETIRNLIKEKLLAGEKVSGYCFDRFEVDCSGGFWRSVLAKAVADLKSEGHRVGEIKLAGRLYSFLFEVPALQEEGAACPAS